MFYGVLGAKAPNKRLSNHPPQNTRLQEFLERYIRSTYKIWYYVIYHQNNYGAGKPKNLAKFANPDSTLITLTPALPIPLSIPCKNQSCPLKIHKKILQIRICNLTISDLSYLKFHIYFLVITFHCAPFPLFSWQYFIRSFTWKNYCHYIYPAQKNIVLVDWVQYKHEQSYYGLESNFQYW